MNTISINNLYLPFVLFFTVTFSYSQELHVLNPEHDTYVRGGLHANTNYGSNSISVKYDNDDYNRQAYLRFNLTGFPKDIISEAKLRLTTSSMGNDASITPYSVSFVSNDGWNENSTTWNNKPTVGFKDDVTYGNANFMEWDVLDIIQANGNDYVSFKLQGDIKGAQRWITFYSKEVSDPSKRPQLIIKTKPVLNPVEDTYVRGGSYANSNFGSVSAMVVKKGDPQFHRQTYLRFNLTDYPKWLIKNTKLRMTVKSAGTDVPSTNYAVHFVSNDGWDEHAITWNTRPSVSPKYATAAGNTNVIEWDVSNMVQDNGNDYVSINIQSESIASQSDVTFYSKEFSDVSKRPQLLIETKAPINFHEPDPVFSTMRTNYFNWLYGTESIDFSNTIISSKYNSLLDGNVSHMTMEKSLNYYNDSIDFSDVSQFDFSVQSNDDYNEAKLIFSNILPGLCLAFNTKGSTQNPNPNYRSADVLNKIMKVFDYLHDRGWDSTVNLNYDGLENYNSTGYVGYYKSILHHSLGYGHAVMMMREYLDYSSRLDRELATLKHITTTISPEYDSVFDYDGLVAGGIRTIMPMRLLYILSQRPSATDRQSNMVNFHRFMEKALSIAPGWAGVIKPDFTGYHHRAIYSPAYSVESYEQLAIMSYVMNYDNQSSYTVGKPYLDNLVEALLTTRILANKYDAPFSVTGRFPMDKFATIVGAIPTLALLSELDITKKGEVKGAFKRLYDPNHSMVQRNVLTGLIEVSLTNTLGSVEIVEKLSSNSTAESAPNGSWFKPYGCLSVHRRGDWMVSVKGISKYVWNFEKGSNQNRYGWNLSSGSIQLLSAGSPVSNIESGYVLDGWDWRRIPGVTTKAINPGNFPTANNTDDHRFFSKEKFAGGVVQNDNAIFAMQFNEPHTTISDVKAKKSVFMFDEYLVALGSDISGTGDIETTISQNSLGASPANSLINGAIQSGLNGTYSGGGAPVWFSDAHNNGYFVPNSLGLKIKRSNETQPFHNGIEDRSGNFITSWIEHGISISGKGYEFYILPSTTNSAIQDFANNYTAKFNVLKKDNKAHVVKYIPTNQVGIVIFNTSVSLTNTKLVSANKPCLVMLDESVTNKLKVAVSNPDFNRNINSFPDKLNNITAGPMEHAGSRPVPTELIFDGYWEIDGSSSGIISLTYDYDNNQTIINFNCLDAKTIEVTLRELEISTVYINPQADAFVRSGGYANSNYGSSIELISKNASGDFNREIFLKFDLNSIDVNFQHAKVSLMDYPYSNSLNDLSGKQIDTYLVSNDNWGEGTITWNNRPLGESLVSSIPKVSGRLTWDVTDAVSSEINNDDLLTLKIKNAVVTSTPLRVYSKESGGSNTPQLEIIYFAPKQSSSGRQSSLADTSLAIKYKLEEGFVNIYPNPTKSFVNIIVDNKFGDFNLRLINSIGVTLLNKSYQNNGSRIVDELDMSTFQKGIYLLEFNFIDKLIIKKIILE